MIKFFEISIIGVRKLQNRRGQSCFFSSLLGNMQGTPLELLELACQNI